MTSSIKYCIKTFGKVFFIFLTHWERRPQIFIPKRKSISIASSNWQHKFLYFHDKSVKNLMFCVDKIKYEHLAILSNLKVANLHLKYWSSIFKYVANLRNFKLYRLKKFSWTIATFTSDKWGLISCSIFFSFLWYIFQDF